MRAWWMAALLIGGEVDARTRVEGDLPRKAARALEDTPGLETLYSQVRTSEGVRLRTILTRPEGGTAPLPAIFLAQWVSCGSLEFRPERDSQLKALATRTGLVLVRVERSGTGDSEGAPCSTLDYETELRHYREAFDQVARHPWIDGSRIVIFGSSLGATLAPLIAEGKPVAGIAVQGGGALTYLERMIAFDRLYLERSGKYRPDQIQAEMLRRIRFHTHYLLERKTPDAVEREHPDLRGVWRSIRGATEAPPHYGRPFAWHWQAAARDVLAAWTKVTAPVLVIYGGFDQFERAHGHRLIADTVNRLRPGSASYVEVPKGDHELELYATAEDAYAYRGADVKPELLADLVSPWLRRIFERDPSATPQRSVVPESTSTGVGCRTAPPDRLAAPTKKAAGNGKGGNRSPPGA